MGTSDIMFKAIMKSDSNKEYVSYIVSEITHINQDYILNNLKFNPVEFIVTNKNEKQKRSDLIIELDIAYINLEMNSETNKTIHIRNIVYKDKINIMKFKKNDNYGKGKLVIQINFDLGKKYPKDKIVYKWITMEEELKISYNENKETYTVDLEKVKDKCYNKKEMNLFERYLAILIARDKKELLKISKGDKILEGVALYMCNLNEDEIFVGMYEKEEEEKMIRNSYKSEGMDEGINKGIDKGIKQNKYETVRNMLEDNVDIELIEKYTGLPKEEIEKIKIEE